MLIFGFGQNFNNIFVISKHVFYIFYLFFHCRHDLFCIFCFFLFNFLSRVLSFLYFSIIRFIAGIVELPKVIIHIIIACLFTFHFSIFPILPTVHHPWVSLAMKVFFPFHTILSPLTSWCQVDPGLVFHNGWGRFSVIWCTPLPELHRLLLGQQLPEVATWQLLLLSQSWLF